MNKSLKKWIRKEFDAPVPLQKEVFLRKFRPARISTSVFIRTQIGYIRKWVWGLDICVLLTALLGFLRMQADLIWMLSSLTPILALSLLAESRRSDFHGMAELEMSTQFSLKSVTLARISILGITNLLLFCLLIPLGKTMPGYSLFQTGIYLFCPYLLTAFSGLCICRSLHSKEAFYLCAGLAVLISFGSFFLHRILPHLYENQNFPWWIGFFCLLTASVVRENLKTIKQTEELVWN